MGDTPELEAAVRQQQTKVKKDEAAMQQDIKKVAKVRKLAEEQGVSEAEFLAATGGKTGATGGKTGATGIGSMATATTGPSATATTGPSATASTGQAAIAKELAEEKKLLLADKSF